MLAETSRSYDGPADAMERFEKLLDKWRDHDHELDTQIELAECNDLRAAFALGKETAAQTERLTILRVHQALMDTVLGGTVAPRETPLTQNPEKKRYVMTVDDLSDYVRRSFNVALDEYVRFHTKD